MIKNNKGFAITTVIYGLSIMGLLLVAIMMATMSATRNNTSSLAKSVEEELNRVGKSEISFAALVDNDASNTPLAQQFIVPEGQSGYYKIELWGSQGGGEFGGFGAYTSGIIKLNEGDVLYFYVGRHQASQGGRETDVRIYSGDYNEPTSYRTRIMVAAGGGAETRSGDTVTPGGPGGTLFAYTTTMLPIGGAINVTGSEADYKLLPAGSTNYSNGTLAGLPNGYARTNIYHGITNTDYFRPTFNGNGGDGYYPSNTASMGGTSYISGYGGVVSIKLDTGGIEGNKMKMCSYKHKKQIYNENNNTTSWIDSDENTIFLDGKMYAGVNRGDGKVKIERLSTSTENDKIIKNKKMTQESNITSIRDCVSTNAKNANVQYVRISAILNGNDLANSQVKKLDINDTIFGQSYRCAKVNIGVKRIDEISVWHSATDHGNNDNYYPPFISGMNDGTDIVGHVIQAEVNGTWVTLKGGSNTYNIASETEEVTGTRISAYQSDTTDNTKPLAGDYYIMPVLTPGKVITAADNSSKESNPLKVEYINGYKRQKWSVQLITDTTISPGYNASNPATWEYKIIENARFKALTIFQDENKEKNQIKADRSFNNLARDVSQIWKITPIGDGTYTLATAAVSNLTFKNTGNIVVQSNQGVLDFQNSLIIAKNEISTERFKFISVDYSSN